MPWLAVRFCRDSLNGRKPRQKPDAGPNALLVADWNRITIPQLRRVQHVIFLVELTGALLKDDKRDALLPPLASLADDDHVIHPMVKKVIRPPMPGAVAMCMAIAMSFSCRPRRRNHAGATCVGHAKTLRWAGPRHGRRVRHPSNAHARIRSAQWH